jgi:predicted Rdx family selenoprotein
MAVWTAVELHSAFGGDVGISITPVGGGRLEVYLDGELLFDNKALGIGGMDKEHITELKMTIRERLEVGDPVS